MPITGEDLIELLFEEDNDQQKDVFRYEYTIPSLDWYHIEKVEIKPSDYCYFRIELRYGPSWWLIGTNPPDDRDNGYQWEDTTIGELPERELIRFIEWAKNPFGGSNIIEFKAISGSLDVLQMISKLLRRIGNERKTD